MGAGQWIPSSRPRGLGELCVVGTSGPWSWERSPEELIKARAEAQRQTLDGA